MGRRRTAAVIIIGTAAASAWLGNSSALDAGPLRGSPRGEGVIIVNQVATTKPTWHYGSFVVCLKDDDPVTLDAISPSVVGGVHVAATRVKTVGSGELAGSWPGAIPAAYGTVAGFKVSGRCSNHAGAEIVLQLDSSPTTGAVDGFVVNYHRGDQHYRTLYSARIVLCATTPTGLKPRDAEVLGECERARSDN